MERLKFYNIDEEYITYLYKFDKKVPFNKESKRPYIGIVLEINGIIYFAPMFSPKKQHSRYKSNATYVKIGENLGIIRLNNMIPVNKENLKYIDFNTIKDGKYKNLLIQQNNFIQLNTDIIRKKANKLYKFVTIDKKEFFIELCCDFRMLEEKCSEYRNSICRA
ncbi:MAG: type III toxin-antitoxin system ToxN/AbiQ family toxin [Clostridia bacterium]